MRRRLSFARDESSPATAWALLDKPLKEILVVLCPRVLTPEALEARCRGEFLEMPGLHLTLPQAARLFGLDKALCKLLLDELVESGFLRCSHGTYMRACAGRHAA